jgi:polyisoprenoid-binding protein YceI
MLVRRFLALSGILLGLAATYGGAQHPTPASNRYEVYRGTSSLVAITGTAGLFGFAGHEHAILATEWSAEPIIDAANLERSFVKITIPVSSLVIDSAEARRVAGLGPGPGPEDVRKIQETMLGPLVLDAPQYPTIEFTATSVARTGPAELRLTGEFLMRGRTHPLTVAMRYAESGNGRFGFSGQFTIRQTDFGIQPESAGLGTVKVKNEVQIRFQVSVAPAS